MFASSSDNDPVAFDVVAVGWVLGGVEALVLAKLCVVVGVLNSVDVWLGIIAMSALLEEHFDAPPERKRFFVNNSSCLA